MQPYTIFDQAHSTVRQSFGRPWLKLGRVTTTKLHSVLYAVIHK